MPKPIKNIAMLDAMSPLKVLSRGYSIATDTEGKIISYVNDAHAGKEFSLRLSDGDTKAKFI